jgi:formiminoglutamase
MRLFDKTIRPDESLFYKREDPNDLRLGDIVASSTQDFKSSEIVLLGLPQDEGVRRNRGRVGAKDAPDAIRRCLYKLVAKEGLKLFDLGNTVIEDTLEATHNTHREVVRRVLANGKRLVVLGGGNDTSYPDCSALAMETEGDILAFNIDAHFDVRADAIRNSGTPYRQLLEEGHILPENFYEVAYQHFANSSNSINYLAERGVWAYDLSQIRSIGIRSLLMRLLQRGDAIFWGLDMDVVRAADAPGVSAINPIGLTGSEFCEVARVAGADPRTGIFEITEVNPTYDIDERTCRLAAVAVWHFLDASTR